MVPHFRERGSEREGSRNFPALRGAGTHGLPGHRASQGWETLLEASSEFGHSNDRTGWVQCGLWLRARINAPLVQLGGQEIALDTRGK